MEIGANERIATAYFMEEAKAKAYQWVAFDLSNSNHMNYLQGFESAGEAIDFCSAANTAFDYGGQSFMEAHFQFMPFQSLLEAIDLKGISAHPFVDPDQLMAKLAAQDVQLLRSQDKETLIPLIQAGSVFPVQFDRKIDPEQEVDRFIVVAHHHNGHQVDEIGHSVNVIDTLPSLEQAEAIFNDLIRQYHDNTDKNDYQLIGLYRYQEYKGDMDGTPKNYCGLTLKKANYQYDPDLQAKTWRVDNLHQLNEAQNIRHFLYARYDHADERFKLLDDRLREIRPEELKTSTYPSYIINEKFTIKQLEIMNEQSYDYVKDQLKYLGFGEEIAKPLREKMEEGAPEFTLNQSRDFGVDKTSSVLHFSKGDDVEKDMTFLNRFDMTLKQPGKEDLTQTFFVGKEHNYTLQERYNMMDGRFVYREQPKLMPVEENGKTRMKPTGETYMGWKGLNFKETHEDGNFKTKTMFWRHDKEIVKYPLKEVAEPYDKNRLLASMQKGNKANVTIMRGDEEIKGTVVANPKMQRFDFYDANGQTLFLKQVEKQKLAKTEHQEQTLQQPKNAEKIEENQVKEKNETVSSVNEQNTANTESKGHATQQPDQQAPKESQKMQVAEEHKESPTHRKKHSVKM